MPSLKRLFDQNDIIQLSNNGGVMAKQSKAKARKKAQNKAKLVNEEQKLSNTQATHKNKPNIAQKSSKEVIIDDHLKVKPNTDAKVTFTEESTKNNDTEKISFFRKVSLILLVVVAVLLLLLGYFYNKTHKASYKSGGKISILTNSPSYY